MGNLATNLKRDKQEKIGDRILRARREEFCYKLNPIASKELAIYHLDSSPYQAVTS